MATFSFPDAFKEHKEYIVLLKKALQTVKPGVEKKFLYFAQYPFGPKKLPLVLVDFDLNCKTILTKAGHKPTAEGVVKLTDQEELNFEPDKGTLKRVRIRKYFGTMGQGLKPVFVPPGEEEDDEEGGSEESTTSVQGELTLPPTTSLPPRPMEKPRSEPPPSTTSTGGQMAKKIEFEENQFKLRQRIEEVQSMDFPPNLAKLKEQALVKAIALGKAGKFGEAGLLLDQLATRAVLPGTEPRPLPSTPPPKSQPPEVPIIQTPPTQDEPTKIKGTDEGGLGPPPNIPLPPIPGSKPDVSVNVPQPLPDDPCQALDQLSNDLDALNVKAGDPITHLDGCKSFLAAKKKSAASLKLTQLAEIQQAIKELDTEVSKFTGDSLALGEISSEVESKVQLVKTKIAKAKPDKTKLSAFTKKSGALQKKLAPAVKDYGKLEAGFGALQVELKQKLAQAQALAPAPDNARLVNSISNLPKLPGSDTLFPPKGVSGWRKDLSKGGAKAGAKLFGDVVKAWEAAEKKTNDTSLEKLEKAAALCLAALKAIAPEEPDDTDRARIDKCTEALALVRKMRLKNEIDGLPTPPWNEKQAQQARQIEARALLESGTPSKPPGEKGESDSFFLKNSEGKPAFIFKPKQGENVKEGGKEGEGVVREVLSSKFNESIKEMTGLDFGICPTSLARLESDSFTNGELSKEKSRVGALQQAAPNEGSLLKRVSEEPDLVKSIKTEDVQKIALLDFMTLQGDRNPANLLVQDVNGEKRLVPIDGGFAFPTTELFNVYSVGMASDSKFDPDRPAPTDDDERAKFEESAKGKNALMQLPQSEEKFTPEMLKHIDSLDPNKVVKAMKEANKELESSAPELKGMVGDENLENVRRSIIFLKRASKEFTVAQLGEIYALDFKRILAVPSGKVQKEIEAVIAQGRARCVFNKAVGVDKAAYEQLGGDAELTKLGWDLVTDRRLRHDWKRKIEILQKREQAPPPQPIPPPEPKPPTDDESLERDFRALGGEKELQKIMARADYAPKLPNNPKLVAKVAKLRVWKKFKDYGGDAAYKKLVQQYRENLYTPFHELSKVEQAAVATFVGSWEPDTLGMGSKVDAFKDFNNLNK